MRGKIKKNARKKKNASETTHSVIMPLGFEDLCTPPVYCVQEESLRLGGAAPILLTELLTQSKQLILLREMADSMLKSVCGYGPLKPIINTQYVGFAFW